MCCDIVVYETNTRWWALLLSILQSTNSNKAYKSFWNRWFLTLLGDYLAMNNIYDNEEKIYKLIRKNLKMTRY